MLQMMLRCFFWEFSIDTWPFADVHHDRYARTDASFSPIRMSSTMVRAATDPPELNEWGNTKFTVVDLGVPSYQPCGLAALDSEGQRGDFATLVDTYGCSSCSS